MSNDGRRFVLVVPCYNEAERLDGKAFLESIEREADLDLVFVDDGSEDATAERLETLTAAAPERIRSLGLDRNEGKAEAVRRGMQAALEHEPAFVGYWDADLSTPLRHVRLFMDVFAEQPQVRAVFGSRVRLLGRTIRRNRMRHYLGRVVATIISTRVGLPVYDTQCGAKIYRAGDALAGCLAQPFASRWLFDAELMARFVRACDAETDAENVFFEYPLWEWRDVAGSKLGLASFPSVLLDLFRFHRAVDRYRPPERS